MRKLATEMDKIHTLQQVEDIRLTEGGTGGYRSCFTENKMGLSEFMKNNNIGISHFAKKKERLENHSLSQFTATMEVTIHEGKNSHFTFHGNKRPIAGHENTLFTAYLQTALQLTYKPTIFSPSKKSFT